MRDSYCAELLRYMPSSTDVKNLRSSLMINCVVNAFLAYSTVILNCVTIHAVRKTSSLSTPLKTLLLSLAVSDVSIGLLNQPFYVALLSRSLQGFNLDCTAYTSFTFVIVFFTSASLFGVMAVSVDRYMAIHLHLRYRELVTEKRIVAGVVLIWVLSGCMSSIFLWIPPNLFALTFAIAAAICLLFSTFLYFKIYTIVKRHSTQIRQMQLQRVRNAFRNDELMTNFASLRKSAIGTFYVYAVFLLCYTPHTFSLIAISARAGSPIAMKGLYLYSLTLTFLNSCLNPVIYCWKMRPIRRAVLNSLPFLRNTERESFWQTRTYNEEGTVFSL